MNEVVAIERNVKPDNWADHVLENIAISCSRLHQCQAGILSYKKKTKESKIRSSLQRKSRFTSSLSSFQSRLAWHCHFMQRLEAEATMNEFAINPELDEILHRELDQHKFTAWRDGKTGWPF